MTALDQKAAGFLRYDRTIGLLVMTGRGFQYPTDMAIGKNGRLYVTNRTSGYGEGVQVTMCNLDSEYFGAFGSNGKGDGQFVLMSAIATDKQRAGLRQRRAYSQDKCLRPRRRLPEGVGRARGPTG